MIQWVANVARRKQSCAVTVQYLKLPTSTPPGMMGKQTTVVYSTYPTTVLREKYSKNTEREDFCTASFTFAELDIENSVSVRILD